MYYPTVEGEVELAGGINEWVATIVMGVDSRHFPGYQLLRGKRHEHDQGENNAWEHNEHRSARFSTASTASTANQ
jgi:hypothetical protein